MVRTLGTFVRDYLDRTGMTQTALADRGEVPRLTINRLVKEKVALPDADTRRKLATAMGVTHIDILIAAGELEPEEALGAGATLTDTEALPPVIRQLLADIDWSPVNTVRTKTMLETIRDTQRSQPQTPTSELENRGTEEVMRLVPAREDDGE